VYPVADAARVLAEAIEHRRRAVFQPRWLRAVLPVRGILPPLLERGLGSAVVRMDAAASRRAQRTSAEGALQSPSDPSYDTGVPTSEQADRPPGGAR
jgi:hypothetical protein